MVPAGHVALLNEKVEGWQSYLFRPGYYWISTNFIPEKWKIYYVNTNPPHKNISFFFPLKYARYLKLSDEFSIQLTLQIRYKIEEKSILKLADKLDQNIARVDEYIQEKVKDLLRLKLIEYHRSEKDIPFIRPKMLSYFRNLTSEEIQDDRSLQKDQADKFIDDWNFIFQEYSIQLINFKLLDISIPDLTLYSMHLKNLDQILASHQKALTSKIESDAQNYSKQLDIQAGIEKAKHVMDLIKEDSKILEYLKYQDLNPNVEIIRIEKTKEVPEVEESKKETERSIDHKNSENK